jgi:hypothetical protein
MSGTTINYSGAAFNFTVQTTGLYDLTAFGAQGGSGYAGGSGGNGGEIGGDFSLTAGEQLTIIVGGGGGYGTSARGAGGGGGGGGGSFVIETFDGTNIVQIPLVIAGGGGGGGYPASYGNGGGGNTGRSGASGYYGKPDRGQVGGGRWHERKRRERRQL